MEHKLITGGEQYLPFARSRIKAMRATGLKHASQQFEVDGVSIKVRIVGEHEFITLDGSPINVLSGVTKDAKIVSLPIVPPATTAKKTLRKFKPTNEAWVNQQHSDPAKSPTVFADENRFGFVTEQYGDTAPVSGSMFSGLMAKAVQLLMGVGKTAKLPDGLEVPYSYGFAKTHGVTTASDGKLWLVEISLINGVIAMPFEVQKGGSSTAKQKMIREAFKWFKGLPTGKSFPTQTRIAAAITEGSVIRLAAPADLNPFYHKGMYAGWVGWALNNLGSEAHNTCWDSIGGNTTSYHYKIAISIGATVSPREPNKPKATGTATLTMESSGVVWQFFPLGMSGYHLYPTPYGFADPVTGRCIAVPTGVASYAGAWRQPDAAYIVTAFPIFVCYIADVLEVVTIKSEAKVVFSSGGYTAGGEYLGTDSFSEPGYFVDSTSLPGGPSITSITHDPSSITGQTTKTVSNTGGLAANLSTSVIFPGGSRNAYLHFCAGDGSYTTPGGRTYSPPVISVVLSNGKIYTQDQTGWQAMMRAGSYNYNAKWDVDDYGWNNPGDSSATGYLTHSVFGAAPPEAEPHAFFPKSVGNPMLVTSGTAELGQVLKGAELASETSPPPSPSAIQYNFIGYV